MDGCSFREAMKKTPIHTNIPYRKPIELISYYDEFKEYYPNCEMETKAWFVHNVASDWVLFDCGANIGYYSILFSQLAPEGLVYAFEPTETVKMLRENLVHYGVHNVRTLPLALGMKCGRVKDRIFRIWGQPAEDGDYEFVTLDYFVEHEWIRKLDCIKIDVDSFDFEVLQGARETLLRFDPWLMVELNHALGKRGQTVQEALQWMLNLGYIYTQVFDGEDFLFKRDLLEAAGGAWLAVEDILGEFKKPQGDRVFPKHPSGGNEKRNVPKTQENVAAVAYYSNRQELDGARKHIEALHGAVGFRDHFTVFQYAQLIAMVLEFQPDAILQVGMGVGHATCALTEAANIIGVEKQCRVICVGQESVWTEQSEASVRRCMPQDWFEPLKVVQQEFEEFEFESALKDAQRILIWWQNPSLRAAACMLGRVLPLVSNRPHLVLVHNLFDARHIDVRANQYGQNGWWNNGKLDQLTVRLGNFYGTASLVLPLLDFLSRNGIEAFSADHSFAEMPETEKAELRELLGEEESGLYSPYGYWSYFSLAGARTPIIIPPSQ